MLREMVNHDSLPFPALKMNGSLSTSDIASVEIFCSQGSGKGITFCSPGVLGLKQTQEKKSGGIHKIGPEPLYLQFH